MIQKKHLLFIGLVFVFLTISAGFISAQEGPYIDRGDGYSTSGKKEYKKYQYETLKESTKEALKAITDLFNTSSTNRNTNNRDTTNNPDSDTNPNTYTPYTSSGGRQYTNGQLVMYRQYDYKQSLPGGCTISKAGCGPSAVANILANFHDKSIDPVYVVSRHYAATGNNYANCKGSYYVGALKALQTPEYRLKTQVKTFKAGTGIDAVASDLFPFTQRGDWILAAAKFKYGGHFFVITDIKYNSKTNKYQVIGLDSAYPTYGELAGSPVPVPVDYTYMHDYPHITVAIAVKPM